LEKNQLECYHSDTTQQITSIKVGHLAKINN